MSPKWRFSDQNHEGFFFFFYSKHSCRNRGRVLGGKSDRRYWEVWPRRVACVDLLRSRHLCVSEPLLLYFILNVWTPKTCHNSIHARMRKSAQIPKQAARKLRRERAGLFLPDVLCLKKKRCWLTAELLDPTQPGFNADAWLMRSTTGIIIRQGILAFSCVSQAGKTPPAAATSHSAVRLPFGIPCGRVKSVPLGDSEVPPACHN